MLRENGLNIRLGKQAILWIVGIVAHFVVLRFVLRNPFRFPPIDERTVVSSVLQCCRKSCFCGGVIFARDERRASFNLSLELAMSPGTCASSLSCSPSKSPIMFSLGFSSATRKINPTLCCWKFTSYESIHKCVR